MDEKNSASWKALQTGVWLALEENGLSLLLICFGNSIGCAQIAA